MHGYRLLLRKGSCSLVDVSAFPSKDLKIYLWWSLRTLHLLACQVTVPVRDSSLCCCVPCYTWYVWRSLLSPFVGRFSDQKRGRERGKSKRVLSGLNETFSYNIIVHLKQNIICCTSSQTAYSCTSSQTAYIGAALTLHTQNYRHKLWRQQDKRW